MRLIPGCLLLMLLVSNLSPVHGVLETMIINSKCRCMRTVRIQPRLQHIKRVKTTVPWEGCSDPEVIVWLKNKSILCLDPGANTTQSLLRNLPKKRKLSHLILPAPVKT